MKKRLMIAIVAIAALALLIAGASSVWTLRTQEISSARQSLGELLSLMDAQSYDTDAPALLAQFARAVPNKRLTILSTDGVVLADTHQGTTGNHADRPEIAAALKDGSGEALRTSDTTGETMLYAARRFTDGNIGRAAMPVSSVNGLVLRGAGGLLLAVAVALLLVLLLAKRVARQTTQPIEQQEVRLLAQGEKLQFVREEFAANVSHELKTPLTSMKGLTDMLSSGMVADPADQKRFITMIGVEVDRLIELINDVLKLSELESVAMAQPDDRGDVLAAAHAAAEELAPIAATAQVSIVIDGAPLEVALGQNRLRELVTNLIENGLKYNHVGGEVRVTIAEEGNNIVLKVADNGIGIAPESLERVFERFYRADKGRTKKVGGTGLGLAIVKHILMLCGGQIALESTLGEGTTFTVRLPKVQE